MSANQTSLKSPPKAALRTAQIEGGAAASQLHKISIKKTKSSLLTASSAAPTKEEAKAVFAAVTEVLFTAFQRSGCFNLIGDLQEYLNCRDAASKAYEDEDWEKTKTLNQERLVFVPDSLMAGKHLSFSNFMLGKKAFDEGRLADAEIHFNTSIEWRIKTLGEQNEEVGRVYLELGRVSNAVGDYEKAENLVGAAMKIFEKNDDSTLADTQAIYEEIRSSIRRKR